MIPFQWFLEAKERISPHIQITPTTYDPIHNIFLKWENQQFTGSFKVRGAFNKVLALETWEQESGLLAASAGNHGQGVALAGKFVDAPVRIFVSDKAPQVKIDAMRVLGADVTLVSGSYGDAENAALKLASESKATWVSPYNDGHIIAGQGTIALETYHQIIRSNKNLLENSTWVVPTGGGGLLSGVAAVLNHLLPGSRVLGVQTDTSPFMHNIFHHGSQDGVIEYPTIADGLAGRVEEGSITIPMVRQFVDDIILVDESETSKAVAYAWHHYNQKIEGASAVTLAAVLSGKIPVSPVVVFLSGGNIQDDVFNEIIRGGTA